MDTELLFIVLVILILLGWGGSLSVGYDAGGFIHLLLLVIVILFIAKALARRGDDAEPL